MIAGHLRRWCPAGPDLWLGSLREDAQEALRGARERREQARKVAEEAQVMMDRFYMSEARNHFREHLEFQFGKGFDE